MSTQPETGNDLDRTDVLPQLDLAAYEAAEGEADPLTRTDTWAVEALRTHSTPDDGDTAPTVLRPPQPASDGADISVDVDRVLNRIAELEAGIRDARTAQAEAESQRASLIAERDTFEQRLAAVEASNARLNEQSAISQELAQRLEQQLREQSEQHRVQLGEIEAAYTADQLAAQKDRVALEYQIEQAAADLSGAAAQHAQLQAALDEALALAATRAERIDELQQALTEEEGVAYGLSRNLAAKLAEHDTLAATLAQRNAAIAALVRERDDLGVQQQQSTTRTNAEIEQLTQELQASNAQRDELAITAEQLAARNSEKNVELADVSVQLAAAQSDSAALRSELEKQSSRTQAMQEELAAAHRQAATLQSASDELQRALEESQQQALQLEAALKDNTSLLNARNAELDAARLELNQRITAMRSAEQALHERDTLIETLRGEVRTAQDESEILTDELSKARSRMKSMAQHIVDADNQIATLKADLAVHTEALAAIRRDIERPEALATDRDERILEPLNHDGEPVLLNRKVMTLGRTEDNDIWIASKLISRHHARLLVGPNAVVVEDAGSTNGCFVNGRQVRRHVLRENDVLTLGDLKFRLRLRPANSITRSRGNVVDFNKPA